MSPNFEEFQSRPHFSLLDGIRAMAIMAVMWHHSNGIDPFVSDFFARGYLGVDLFFVLSGFLITHLLIREKSKTGTIDFKKFYIRRSLRIFPLYYGYLLFFVLLTVYTKPERSDDLVQALPYYVFYIANWAPEGVWHFFHRAWSLAVEEQFYFVWPLAIASLGFIYLSRVIVLILGINCVIFLGYTGQSAIDIAHEIVPYRTILFGALLAILLNSNKGYRVLSGFMNHRALALVWLVLLIGYVFILSGAIQGFEQLLIHVLMVLFVGSCVVSEQNYLAPMLRSKIFVLIGTISYGIYILHGQLWGVTQKLVNFFPQQSIAQSKVLFFIVFMLVTVPVAMMSYRYFESIFLKIKHRFQVG